MILINQKKVKTTKYLQVREVPFSFNLNFTNLVDQVKLQIASYHLSI
jgi:hypothetical protein